MNICIFGEHNIRIIYASVKFFTDDESPVYKFHSTRDFLVPGRPKPNPLLVRRKGSIVARPRHSQNESGKVERMIFLFCNPALTVFTLEKLSPSRQPVMIVMSPEKHIQTHGRKHTPPTQKKHTRTHTPNFRYDSCWKNWVSWILAWDPLLPSWK